MTNDALLLVSFGGPEGPGDVLPFLENVVEGKNVPPERLREVAAHYDYFDGVSPINAQNRALLVAIVGELNLHGPRLPVYWGNRHWHPMLPEAVQQMADDGVRRALALVTSAFSSPPGCREYLEDIEQAREEVGASAPQIEKIRVFYNHPGFFEAMADRVWDALEQVPPERRAAARLVYTAHSIPVAMAKTCPYEEQLREACRLVSERLNIAGWDLAYQNRSGPPSQAWLEPDVREHLCTLAAAGGHDVVIAPIGFVCEHMEIAYDLDVEVRQLCDELGIEMVRAGVVAQHPRFVKMVRELVLERMDSTARRLALGAHGPWPDQCPAGCCGRG
jgi:ferrochelatase